MYSYQLDSKELDNTFLRKDPVICLAVLHKEIYNTLNVGDKIVIQLSNRAKYMGIIKDLKFKFIDEFAHGHMEIIKG
jgi:hypothetical protein